MNYKSLKSSMYFKFIYKTIILFGLFSCSTIKQIDRTNKDISLDNKKFAKINGIYSNKNIISPWTLDGIIFKYKSSYKAFDNDSIRVRIKTINDNKLEIGFMKNDLCLMTVKLRGKYSNGYFSMKPKFRFLTSYSPLFWEPGFYNLSLGITKSDNLVMLESHGGIEVIIFLPFFANGANSENEFKRLE